MSADKREIGDEAVWSLSTAKPGNGVEQIRDGTGLPNKEVTILTNSVYADNVDTYWQSDGGQPHLINIQFHKKMTILEVSFYLDYKLDESYTPKKLSIRAGTTFHDLVEIHVMELNEPIGWVAINLGTEQEHETKVRAPRRDADRPLTFAHSSVHILGQMLRAQFIQICVVSMHQNGRDTHIRQAKIYGPREPAGGLSAGLPEASSVDFTMWSCIR
jgi:anaphase-promoting complex subunit 10